MEDMIAQNTGLIFKQLIKFGLRDDPEAESIGYEALYTAIQTFDTSKNVQLSTYATVCIYNALGCYVRQLNKQRQLEVVSYNNIAYSDDGEDHEFVDYLPACTDIEEEYIMQEQVTEALRCFSAVYDRLTNETHKRIIDAWRDTDYSGTTVQIATMANVSQPYASQILCKFKSNLKLEVKNDRHR